MKHFRYWISYGLVAVALAIIVPLAATDHYEGNARNGILFALGAFVVIVIVRVFKAVLQHWRN
jgi:hypothetical protein